MQKMMADKVGYCPACEKDRPCSKVEKKDAYELYRCQECAVVFSFPMKAGDSDFYETFTEYGDKWEFKRVAQFLLNQKDMAGKELLDIACGDGRFLSMLPSKLKVTGIDFNPLAIDTARKKAGLKEVFCLTLADFRAQYPARKFDVVTAFHILEHLENPGAFLEELKKCLRPSGNLYLSVPNAKRWTLLENKENWDYPPHHLTRWDSKSLEVVLNSHGFEVLHSEREPVRTFAQVESVCQDAVWKWAIEKLSSGVQKQMAGDNPGQSPALRKNIRLQLYLFARGLKIHLLNALIFFLTCLFSPWAIFSKKEGKSLLIMARSSQ